jgi:hypothetical protein
MTKNKKQYQGKLDPDTGQSSWSYQEKVKKIYG